ncbi:hypothetical protein Tco_0492865 [Tanacetum coccineum]
MHLRPNQERSSYSRYSRRQCSILYAICSPDPACDENNFENCHNKSSFDGLEPIADGIDLGDPKKDRRPIEVDNLFVRLLLTFPLLPLTRPLKWCDPEILIATLETLSALVKVNPSKLHPSVGNADENTDVLEIVGIPEISSNSMSGWLERLSCDPILELNLLSFADELS